MSKFASFLVVHSFILGPVIRNAGDAAITSSLAMMEERKIDGNVYLEEIEDKPRIKLVSTGKLKYKAGLAQPQPQTANQSAQESSSKFHSARSRSDSNSQQQQIEDGLLLSQQAGSDKNDNQHQHMISNQAQHVDRRLIVPESEDHIDDKQNGSIVLEALLDKAVMVSGSLQPVGSLQDIGDHHSHKSFGDDKDSSLSDKIMPLKSFGQLIQENRSQNSNKSGIKHKRSNKASFTGKLLSQKSQSSNSKSLEAQHAVEFGGAQNERGDHQSYLGYFGWLLNCCGTSNTKN